MWKLKTQKTKICSSSVNLKWKCRRILKWWTPSRFQSSERKLQRTETNPAGRGKWNQAAWPDFTSVLSSELTGDTKRTGCDHSSIMWDKVTGNTERRVLSSKHLHYPHHHHHHHHRHHHHLHSWQASWYNKKHTKSSDAIQFVSEWEQFYCPLQDNGNSRAPTESEDATETWMDGCDPSGSSEDHWSMIVRGSGFSKYEAQLPLPDFKPSVLW